MSSGLYIKLFDVCNLEKIFYIYIVPKERQRGNLRRTLRRADGTFIQKLGKIHFLPTLYYYWIIILWFYAFAINLYKNHNPTSEDLIDGGGFISYLK